MGRSRKWTGGRHAGVARLPHRSPTVESITINLAGTDYEIKELTLGQLEDIQSALSGEPGAMNRKVIAIACEEYPEITVEKLKKLRLGSIRKVDGIVRSILKFAGYSLKDKPEGEAPAGAA
jgi:hypothetical protein